MRKDKLIKILQNIKGNPEVVLWNGFVDDWMPILEPFVFELARIKKSALKNLIEKQHNTSITDDHLNESFKNYSWVEVDEYTSKYKTMYNTKKVILINAGSRNKHTYDRGGRISY